MTWSERTNCIMTHIRTNITSEPFSNPHVREILNRVINVVGWNVHPRPFIGVDPFARESFTTKETTWITNDLNPDMNTTYNLEAKQFSQILLDQMGKSSIDLVLFDPPYSLRQLKDCYDGIGKDLELWQTQNMWGECKDDLAQMIKPGGYVVSFGWSSSGFGSHRGFEKKEIHLFENGGREDRYDIIMVIERKVQTTLDSLFEGIEEE